jgi:hypothetical protein
MKFIAIYGRKFRYQVAIQTKHLRTLFSILTAFLLVSAQIAEGQCIGNISWNGGTPSSGEDTANAIILGTIPVRVISNGTFASGRPSYGIGSSNYGGFDYQSLRLARGASFATGTYTYFKLQSPLDANYIHIRVSDIRGDGLNTEHQRVRGFLNGVPVPANFVDPQNGATITGGNIITAPGTTTPLIQASMRAFFTGPVDSIIVTATGWSDYVIVELFTRCDILLPFQLLDFTGQRIMNSISLSWKTGTEESVLAYQIERSADGKKWEKAGMVSPETSDAQVKNYSFTDNNPMNGKNYYRLSSKESDGKTQLSKVLMIYFHGEKSNTISIFPNPVTDRLLISIDAKDTKIISANVFTIDGKLIKKINPNAFSFKIDSKEWHKGIYLIQLTTSNGDIISHKIIRN